MALVSATRGTRLGTNAWRDGVCRVPARASSADATYREAGAIACARVTPARATGTSSCAIWVPIMRQRRSIASAMRPPSKASAICGTARARPSRPMCHAEFVSSYICHAIATVVTWLPSPESTTPPQKRRKSRWRSAAGTILTASPACSAMCHLCSHTSLLCKPGARWPCAVTLVTRHQRPSICWRHRERVEVHVAIGLGPEADTPGHGLGQRVFQVALAIKVAFHGGARNADLELMPLLARGRGVPDPLHGGTLALFELPQHEIVFETVRPDRQI